jgi:DNA-binding XRE family transcriptional regulator
MKKSVNTKLLTAEKKEEVFEEWLALRAGGEMNAVEAAEQVGVTYQTLHKWETQRAGKSGLRGRPSNQTATRRPFVMLKKAQANKPKPGADAPTAAPEAVVPVAAVAAAPAPVEAPVVKEKAKAKVVSLPQQPQSQCTTIKIITPSGCTIICSDVDVAKKLIS